MVEGNPSLSIWGGLIVASFTLPSVLLAGYFGDLADRTKKQNLVVAGAALSIVGLIFMGFQTYWFPALIFALLVGIGVSVFFPILESQLESVCLKHLNLEDKLLGEGNTMWNAGFVVGAFLVGLMLDRTQSFGLAFASTGLLVLIALIGYKLTSWRLK